MEVIIYSGIGEREVFFKRITDDIIMRRRLRLMSLHTSSPRSAEELKGLIKPDKGYLVIMDIDNCPEREKVIAEIFESYRRVKFCLVSESAEYAAESVNAGTGVCGYINALGEGLEKRFESVLMKIYDRVTTVCGGIMTFGGDGSLKIISFSDIYYIETIKQQHRCTIYHKNGTDTMRADISKLINRLDGRFEITRSSTIANLSAVRRIDDGLIFFDDDIFCSVTSKRVGEIRKIMGALTVAT
ncbi:MAG: LytTR family transcriptional regulator DNA-binding domain-containing protein [Oscillospiraceae bacterium]|nr:LytTR family transcriptional regulator DNA-binding domain-containing protein [Oscillospiraceae bacterium]